MTGLRVDKWLWHARLCKTRSLAARLCEDGAVTLRGAVTRRPADSVRIGDTLTLVHGNWRRSVEVLALGERRGPAGEAATLYRDVGERERVARTDADWQPLLVD